MTNAINKAPLRGGKAAPGRKPTKGDHPDDEEEEEDDDDDDEMMLDDEDDEGSEDEQ